MDFQNIPEKTGIAGYTLTYNSYGLTLSAHEPFDWSNEAVRDELDIVSHQEAVEYRDKRILVGDTDVGKRMMIRIEELKKLIQAYQDAKSPNGMPAVLINGRG